MRTQFLIRAREGGRYKSPRMLYRPPSRPLTTAHSVNPRLWRGLCCSARLRALVVSLEAKRGISQSTNDVSSAAGPDGIRVRSLAPFPPPARASNEPSALRVLVGAARGRSFLQPSAVFGPRISQQRRAASGRPYDSFAVAMKRFIAPSTADLPFGGSG